MNDLGEKGVYVINGESSLSDTGSDTYEYDNSIIENDNQNIQSCQYGIESTVLKINQDTNTLLIYRLGAITKSDLERCLKAYGQGLESWNIEITSRQVSLPSIITNKKNNNNNQQQAQNNDISNTNIITDMNTNNANNNNNNQQQAQNNDISNTNIITDMNTNNSANSNHDQKLKVITDDNTTQGEVAPGQAITHYSPDVPCYIINSIQHNNGFNTNNIQNNDYNTISHTNSNNNNISNCEIINIKKEDLKNTVIIDFNGQLQSLATYALNYRDLSPTGNVKVAARHLFDYLRWSENIPNVTQVYLPTMILCTSNNNNNNDNNNNNSNDNSNDNNNNEFLDGVADRINRAASGKTIKLSIF